MTELAEFRPENWTDILHENISLEWIKNNAKFYILSYSDSSSHALLWKVKETEGRGWSGVRMKREYEKDKGYFMDFEPLYIDVEWAIDGDKRKRNDITSSFDEAVELANLHTT